MLRLVKKVKDTAKWCILQVINKCLSSYEVKEMFCDKYLPFSPLSREKMCRKEFFYNAFRALSFNGIDGDYVEFGCCGGMTFALAYHEARRFEYNTKLWSFDSFQGLPAPEGPKDAHPVWKQREMTTLLDQFYAICDSNKIPRDAYSVVPGFYKQSLSMNNTVSLPENISLAYIDCDLYSSTKTVLEFLMPRLKHGMIIAFDDYFCWSATQISGERKAMMELFSKDCRWEMVPYMQFGWHGNSFVIEDKKISSS